MRNNQISSQFKYVQGHGYICRPQAWVAAVTLNPDTCDLCCFTPSLRGFQSEWERWKEGEVEMKKREQTEWHDG